MAITVEYVFVRPSADVSWPDFTASQEAEIQALRESHNISSTDTYSENGLMWKRIQTAESQAVYDPFYAAAKPVWDAAQIVAKAEERGVTISMNVENT